LQPEWKGPTGSRLKKNGGGGRKSKKGGVAKGKFPHTQRKRKATGRHANKKTERGVFYLAKKGRKGGGGGDGVRLAWGGRK